MSSKGQSANELLVIYMFIMLIFTVFVAGFSQQRSADVEQEKIALADSIGEQFAYEVNLAATSGSGYSRKVTYPLLLDGVTPYKIVVNNISKSIAVQLVNISAKVTDMFGNPVPDGTLVNFKSLNNGVIDDFAPTVNGTATAVLITSDWTVVEACVSGV